MPPSVSSHHCQLSPGGRISSGGTLCSEAPDEITCAFITSASPTSPVWGLHGIPVCLASQVAHIWVFFSEIFSPPDSSGQRRPRANPVWRWFHKAALDRGNGKLRAPEVMSPRSRLGPDGSRSSPSLGPRPRRGGDLSPGDHCSCVGGSGKQALGTAQPQARPEGSHL